MILIYPMIAELVRLSVAEVCRYLSAVHGLIRRMAISTIFLLFLMANTASANDATNAQLPPNKNCKLIVGENKHAYIVSDKTLLELDVTNTSSTSLIRKIDVGKTITCISLDKDYLYASASDSILIYSLRTDPRIPRHKIKLDGSIMQFVVQGDYAYCVVIHGGTYLKIVDLKNGKALGKCKIASDPVAISTNGNTAYIASYSSERVQGINVNKPESPFVQSEIVTEYDFIKHRPLDLASNGKALYVLCDERAGLMMIEDLGNKGMKIASYLAMDDILSNIWLHDGRIFMTSSVYDVVIFDSNSHQKRIGKCERDHFDRSGALFSLKNALYVLYESENGRKITDMKIFDVSNPTHPGLLSSFNLWRYPQ